MNKSVSPVSVMVFMFCFGIIGMVIYLHILNKRAIEQKTFFETTVSVALKEGVNKDSIKNALIKSDTLR